MNAQTQNTPGLDILLREAGTLCPSLRDRPGVLPLFGDGSDRRFFRIFSQTHSLVALISPRVKTDSTDENDSYLLIGRHLRSKSIHVPQILHADVEAGRFLLEDAGDLHLQKYTVCRRSRLKPIYRHVVSMLAAMHRKAREGFMADFCFDTPRYDAAFVYERELEYFRRCFLNSYLGMEVGAEDLRSDFQDLAEAAGVGRDSFVFHRDFQSRNIMVRHGRLWLLDFQGMRFGPPAYDVASLLIDPYVGIGQGDQDELAWAYWSSAKRFMGCTTCAFLDKYSTARLCRNLQMLGAFAFLGLVKKKVHFLAYIASALRQLVVQLGGAAGARYPGLCKIVMEAGRVQGRLHESE